MILLWEKKATVCVAGIHFFVLSNVELDSSNHYYVTSLVSMLLISKFFSYSAKIFYFYIISWFKKNLVGYIFVSQIRQNKTFFGKIFKLTSW